MIQQTSVLAYDKELRQPQRMKVYEAICLLSDNVDNWGAVTDKEIGKYLNLPINVITGRRNELVKLGLVYCAGTRHCNVTQKLVRVYRPTFEIKKTYRQKRSGRSNK